MKDKVNVNAVFDWMSGKQEPEPIWADGDRDLLGTDEKGRTQRQTMALKDVRYRLHAEIRPWPGFENRQTALEAQFRRRAERGKCFYQPFLGCREFPAFFRLAEPGGTIAAGLLLTSGPRPHALRRFRPLPPRHRRRCYRRSACSGPRPSGGVLAVPDYASPDVLKIQAGPSDARPSPRLRPRAWPRGRARLRPQAGPLVCSLRHPGSYLEILDLAGDKIPRATTFPKCPELSQPEMKRGGAGCRHFLVDSADVVALLSDGEPDPKLRAKHAYFTNLLRQAAGTLPVLAAVANTLDDPAQLAEIRRPSVPEGQAHGTHDGLHPRRLSAVSRRIRGMA